MSCSPDSILELSCGEGWLVRELASLLTLTRAVGVDAIPALIDQARRAGGGEFIVTPYEVILRGSVNGQVDVAVCNFSLFGEEAVESLFAAVPSLLRPGGLFVVQTLHPVVANGELTFMAGEKAPGAGLAQTLLIRRLGTCERLTTGSPCFPRTGLG